MSATMARQGGRVLLEQSDMRLAMNMARMAKDGVLCDAIKEMKYLMTKPRAEVREEKKGGVEVPGLKQVKATLDRHLAMLRHNLTSGCLPFQSGTAKNPQTGWRPKWTGASPPARQGQPTPPLPGTPPAPTGNKSAALHSEIVILLARYAYSYTALPLAEFLNLDATAQDC